MRWEKLGLIFDAREAGLPDGCVGFAQAPQAVVLDDRIRVFFSTRASDAPGMYISKVAFADFDRQLLLRRVSLQVVLGPGALGCYDEHGVFPLNVVPREGRLLGYIGGWSRRVSVPVDGSIGLAESLDDGRSFRRLGDGPVLGSSPREPFMIGDPFVRVDEGVWRMWYIFGQTWRMSSVGRPERVYKIGRAVSTDGLSWERPDEGSPLIPDVLGADECQAMPTVAKIGEYFHMVFCFRECFDFRGAPGRGYRLGHAVSRDLIRWERDDDVLRLDGTPGSWDGDMQCYPHLFEHEGETFLLYNGNEFGRAGFGAARLVR